MATLYSEIASRVNANLADKYSQVVFAYDGVEVATQMVNEVAKAVCIITPAEVNASVDDATAGNVTQYVTEQFAIYTLFKPETTTENALKSVTPIYEHLRRVLVGFAPFATSSEHPELRGAYTPLIYVSGAEDSQLRGSEGVSPGGLFLWRDVYEVSHIEQARSLITLTLANPELVENANTVIINGGAMPLTFSILRAGDEYVDNAPQIESINAQTGAFDIRVTRGDGAPNMIQNAAIQATDSFGDIGVLEINGVVT